MSVSPSYYCDMFANEVREVTTVHENNDFQLEASKNSRYFIDLCEEIDTACKTVYEKFFYLSLSKNDEFLMNYILSRMNLSTIVIFEGIKHAAYFGLVNILKILLKKSKYFIYNPTLDHASLHSWILNNIEKSRLGLPIGWACGPDSGQWPSTNIQDYFDVLSLLNEHKLNNVSIY